MTLVQKQNAEGQRLLDRLDRVPADDVATSIVTFQEQIEGWLAYLNRVRSAEQILKSYHHLDKLRIAFERYNVLGFDASAQELFDSLRPQCRRIGTLDLRIASIALVTGSILLTRNFVDFEKVPGLRFEDWTAS
jgi:tRNA(fMet)-specific endonuclease VapC